MVEVIVDQKKTIGRNPLKLGAHIYWTNLPWSPHDEYLKPKLRAAFSGSYARVYVLLYKPCKSWYPSTRTGTWDWGLHDAMIQALYDCGVEPIPCIAWEHGAAEEYVGPFVDANYPTGTGLPDPEEWAEYVRDVAEHYRDMGWNPTYWEIFNEVYFDVTDYTNPHEQGWANFVNVYEHSRDAIKDVRPSAKVGTSAFVWKNFTEYLAVKGVGLDWVGFHKYDVDYAGQWTEPEILAQASGGIGYMVDGPAGTPSSHVVYTPDEAMDIYEGITGKRLPLLCTETNMNLAHLDPLLRTLFNGVWYAEQSRDFIKRGVGLSMWFTWDNSDYYTMVKETPPYEVHPPYYVNLLLAENLSVGGALLETLSSDEVRVSTLAWLHGGRAKLLLLNKTAETSSVAVDGLKGDCTLYRIDGSANGIQTEDLTLPSTITMEGYTVVLIDAPTPTSPLGWLLPVGIGTLLLLKGRKSKRRG